MAKRARLGGLLSLAATAPVTRGTALGARPSTREGGDRLGCRKPRPRQRLEQIARAEHVRALLIMPSGSMPSGSEAPEVLWDAAADPGLAVIDVCWDGPQPPVISRAARTAGTTRRDATDFLACLQADKSKAVFEAQNFAVLSQARS
jgi:hypothetical protein